MRRSRYKIHEPTHPHFVTCTILNWLPIFTRKESVDILIQSLKHLQKEENLKLYALCDSRKPYTPNSPKR